MCIGCAFSFAGMGEAAVEAFLTMLATERYVSASTHNQALSASLFLYSEVRGVNLPSLNGVNCPAIGHGHPHGAGTAWPFGRERHHDLHPCAQSGGGGHGEPAGCIGAGALSDRFSKCVRPTAMGRDRPLGRIWRESVQAEHATLVGRRLHVDPKSHWARPAATTALLFVLTYRSGGPKC